MIFMVSAELQSGYYHCAPFYPHFWMLTLNFYSPGKLHCNPDWCSVTTNVSLKKQNWFIKSMFQRNATCYVRRYSGLWSGDNSPSVGAGRSQLWFAWLSSEVRAFLGKAAWLLHILMIQKNRKALRAASVLPCRSQRRWKGRKLLLSYCIFNMQRDQYWKPKYRK